jgi:hypothetical protein
VPRNRHPLLNIFLPSLAGFCLLGHARLLHQPAQFHHLYLCWTLPPIVPPAHNPAKRLSLHIPLRLGRGRFHARLQLSLVQHSRKDVAQVGAQLFDAPLTVAGIRLMHHSILPELLNNFAHLLQVPVQQK